jgi:hypothetical protein
MIKDSVKLSISDKLFSNETIKNILLNSLTDPERYVIEGLYFKGLSEEKISHTLYQDRPVKIPAVRRLHNSAMAKMEDIFSLWSGEEEDLN